MPAMEAELPGSDTSADEAGDTVLVGRANPIAAGVAGTPTADPEGPAFSHVTRAVLLVGAACAVVAGLLLRFWTKSDLWLDEALTVSIARKPLHALPAYLKRDGAPPLFYALLHGWTGIFGTSNLAVRALPGAIGVATLPLAWLAGKRLAGEWAAWAAMLLVATSPFAIRYATEARMYSLVALLTALGYLALDRALRHPRLGNLAAVAAVTALLLYTHYWAFYLLGVTMIWLAYQAWRGRPQWRRGASAALLAGVVGCAAFLPWVPTFLFQSAHTGTPWATPATFAAMVSAVASFAGGSTSEGRALALVFFALVGLGLFGRAADRIHVDLDIRTRPLGRPLAVVLVATLTAAVVGGLATASAFDSRYASVVFIPLLLMVSLGVTVFRDRHVRVGIVTIAVLLGLVASAANVTTNRTQAGEVAAAIDAAGAPGDVVAYCPDQLGPAVNRILPMGRFQQLAFPRGGGPEFIDWVDYASAVRHASSLDFARRVDQMASSGKQIFVVWAPAYEAFGAKCEQLVQTLQSSPRYRATGVIAGDAKRFFQPMYLVRFSPVGS